MTMLTPVRETPASHPRVAKTPDGLPLGVLLSAVAVVRLPFIDGWLGKDEAGRLAVGQQWHTGGTSLDGNYWVDRPP